MPPLRSALIAAGVMAVSTAVLIEGWRLVSFGFDDAAAFALLQPRKNVSDAKRRKEIVDALTRVERWRSEPGVSSRAMKTLFLLQKALQNPPVEEKKLIDFLTVEPTAGQEWLELARLRWNRGAALDEITEALQMSSVTHPRELQTMLYRTLDQIELWEFLPRDMQRTTMNDLVDLARRVLLDQAILVREAFAAKSPRVQEAMKQELQARGDGGRFWLQALDAQH
ncbi:hypothetical protein [Methylocystis heyeri]|uniref:Uncharacterized protein n=1 Tax=Methylocystis heyeri TaxID=391905 RepID=A0A6B8KCS3_9HYPH|nr:hypothetical protein [Methylocystis heyeri]QGM44240.1 hypothetical protein H2LOC_000140 [Methylocystis heyeri]